VSSLALPRPGIALGPKPERSTARESVLDRLALRLSALARVGIPSLTELAQVADRVEQRVRVLRERGDTALGEVALEVRRRLRREGLDGDAAFDGFALVCETARRTLGLEPYRVQTMAGHVILRGMLAEMETGEGKTLTATLPACCAALAGIPVHVVTVNEYLVGRDAELLRPLYSALGLRVGVVRDGDPDPAARRAAYACDITYVSNKQLAFDYLRDRLVPGARRGRLRAEVEQLFAGASTVPLLRGLCFAIVDEADSVLVDEARTPLLLSREGDPSAFEAVGRRALELADVLVAGRDYEIHEARREVELTPAGRERVQTVSAEWGDAWRVRSRREDLVHQALSARHLFQRDDHYLVRDGKVQIIDAHTGRAMPDRSWEAGLHQMIEVKEGCGVTGQRETLARISYQSFFRRYLRLGGMTGTAREVSAELRVVYRLPTVRIPTRLPTARRALPTRMHATAEALWADVASRVAAVHATGRPVLVGTRTVAASEALSARLSAQGLAHEVLNARQDQREAEIVAQAGEAGRITIAAKMAGRGTDIRLGRGVAELGGLHVIAAERCEAGRIDRQLFGRCARQGEPGSFERISSLEDELVASATPLALRRLAARGLERMPRLGTRLAQALDIAVQQLTEQRHARMRRELLRFEQENDHALAFAGPSE
jgi:preprotein translocase subunit SecA